MLKYEILTLGELETNCYIVWDEDSKECVVVDPADDGVSISEEIQAKGLTPVVILLTHGHFDHALGALDLKLIYNIPLAVSKLDLFLLKRQSKTASHFLPETVKSPNIKETDIDLDETEKIFVGKEILKVIKTPGHTPGSVCFFNKNNNILFSGDTLFYDLRGRTDLSYSSTENIFKSLKELMKLPEGVVVLPGHGPETTIEREKQHYVF